MIQNKDAPAARPRGRPRKFDEAEVLALVRDTFWNNGYAATSVDDLATATGLNRPSLYAAFGDKHALYLRALAENVAWSVEGIRQRLEGEGPLRDTLSSFLIEAAENTLAGDMGARGCFVVCTAVTEALRDSATRAIAAGYVTNVDAVFEKRFRRSAGELREGVDPASAAIVASGMLQTLAIRARTGSDRAALARVVEAAVTVICGPRTTA